MNRRALFVLLGVAAAPAAAAQSLRVETGGAHLGRITDADSDAAGRLLLTGGEDGSARLWDTRDGELLQVVRVPGARLGAPVDVALSPDGRWLAAAGGGCGVLVPVGGEVDALRCQRFEGNGVDISTDGRTLAFGGSRFTLTDTGLIPGSERPAHRCGGGATTGKLLLEEGLPVGVTRERLHLYTRDDAAPRCVELPRDPDSVALSPDGERVAVSFRGDDTLWVLRRDRPKSKSHLGAPGWVLWRTALVLGFVAFVVATGALKKHSSDDSGGLVRDWEGQLATLAWSADGEQLYATGRQVRGAWPIYRWHHGAGRRHRLLRSERPVSALRGLPEDRLAVLGAEGSLSIFGPKQELLVRVPPATASLAWGPEALQVDDSGLSVAIAPLEGGAPVTFSVAELDFVEGAALSGPKQRIGRGVHAVDDVGERLFSWSRGVLTAEPLRGDDDPLWSRSDLPPARALSLSADGTLLVAAFGDSTIRWLRARDGALLLSLYLHEDGRWVAWTPSGAYAASVGGEDLIGWEVDSDDGATFFPASRFRDSHHRPQLVSRVLRTLDEAQAELELGLEGLEAAGGHLPPRLELTWLSREGDVARVRLRVDSPKPVLEWRVMVEGRPAAVEVLEDGLRFEAPPREVGYAVFARSEYGWSPAAEGRLGAPVEAQGYALRPALYVLAIGVSDYQDDALDLRYAAQDARDFAALMSTRGGLYREVHTRVLVDAEADRAAVLEGLSWLRESVTQHDVAMVLLSGHGINDADGLYHFVPSDGRVSELRSTMVPGADLQHGLVNLPGKVLVFMDTCHSGAVLGARGAGSRAEGFVNTLSSAENGVIVFTSSSGRQLSVEDPRWENGAFTEALLEGLGGAADYVGRGEVSVNMLDLYLSERVKELTGGAQTPTTAKPRTVSDFPLVVY